MSWLFTIPQGFFFSIAAVTISVSAPLLRPFDCSWACLSPKAMLRPVGKVAFRSQHHGQSKICYLTQRTKQSWGRQGEGRTKEARFCLTCQKTLLRVTMCHSEHEGRFNCPEGHLTSPRGEVFKTGVRSITSHACPSSKWNRACRNTSICNPTQRICEESLVNPFYLSSFS